MFLDTSCITEAGVISSVLNRYDTSWYPVMDGTGWLSYMAFTEEQRAAGLGRPIGARNADKRLVVWILDWNRANSRHWTSDAQVSVRWGKAVNFWE
jgi:hypothetical protein